MFRLLTVFAIVLTLLALPAAAAKRVALVIGNSNYEHVNDLANPANDASLIEKALTETGFEVIRFNDLDQRGMKRAMVEFGRKLQTGVEASMFYYAGHGIEVDGRNYLIPVDSNSQNKSEVDLDNVEVNDFLALMEGSGVPLNIVVLDACRNNPFRSMRATGGGLAPVRAPSGTYVAYATAPGSVAADGGGANSPFTAALAESILQPGLSLEAVFKRTRGAVRDLTGGEQTPFDSSAITGEFYFKPGQAAVAPLQNDTAGNVAKAAFEAAGNNPDLLRVVVQEYGGTFWGKMAEAKLKAAETQVAIATPVPTPGGRAVRIAPDGKSISTRLADAVDAAQPGDRIELLPGRYAGNIFVSKPLDIVGIGDKASIIIEAKDANVFTWTAPSGLLSNLTIIQAGGTEPWGSVFFDNGSAVLEQSTLTSRTGAVIFVRGADANPTIRANVIHDSKGSGLFIYEQAQGKISDNEISKTGAVAIEISTRAAPEITGNRIFGSKGGGIFVQAGARGLISKNEIHDNALAGIEIAQEADPTVDNNIIRDGRQSGIFVQTEGKGILEANTITGNAGAGIAVESGGDPVVQNNKITENRRTGIEIGTRGKGNFTGNTLTGNKKGAWKISAKAGNVKRSGNIE